MKCPYCGYSESKVIDSRPTDEGERIRRRRECLNCAKRFTTYEVIETVPVVVVKKDKSREAFDRNKLLNGLLRACEKRPVPLETLERIVDEIETLLQNSLDREVPSTLIGTMPWISSRRSTKSPMFALLPFTVNSKTSIRSWMSSIRLRPSATDKFRLCSSSPNAIWDCCFLL